jgi:hypothetical protein
LESDKKISALFEGNRITFTDQTPFNIFIGYLIQLLWMQLEDLFFLTINSFISVPILGYPQMIQSVLIKLIFFDIFYVEKWMP